MPRRQVVYAEPVHPWWQLELDCGHTAGRRMTRLDDPDPRPPRRAKCDTCEA